MPLCSLTEVPNKLYTCLYAVWPKLPTICTQAFIQFDWSCQQTVHMPLYSFTGVSNKLYLCLYTACLKFPTNCTHAIRQTTYKGPQSSESTCRPVLWLSQWQAVNSVSKMSDHGELQSSVIIGPAIHKPLYILIEVSNKLYTCLYTAWLKFLTNCTHAFRQFPPNCRNTFIQFTPNCRKPCIQFHSFYHIAETTLYSFHQIVEQFVCSFAKL